VAIAAAQSREVLTIVPPAEYAPVADTMRYSPWTVMFVAAELPVVPASVSAV